jgi:hypothetical protein
MTVEKHIRTMPLCVVECASPLALSLSTHLGNKLPIVSMLSVPLAFVSHFASLLLCVLALKNAEIAKRTQFLSKHAVLQILTTKKFPFRAKANLMVKRSSVHV